MTFRFILIFSLLFQTFGTWAQDSIPANTRVRIYFSPTESFVSQIYDNPAINRNYKSVGNNRMQTRHFCPN